MDDIQFFKLMFMQMTGKYKTPWGVNAFAFIQSSVMLPLSVEEKGGMVA